MLPRILKLAFSQAAAKKYSHLNQLNRVITSAGLFSPDYGARVEVGLPLLQSNFVSFKSSKPVFQAEKEKFKNLYSEIMQEVVRGELKQLNQASEYYFSRPGKLLRPMLIMGMFQLLGGSQTQHSQCKTWSGLVECLHIASLMHDDIIDDSPTRRGMPSHHVKFGKGHTLFAGDYIIARAAKKIAQFKKVEMYQIYASIIGDLTSGEVQQAQRTDDSSVEAITRHYLSKTYFKTGALISHSLRGVATLLGRSQESIQTCFKIGLNLGVAFQIVDDILDFEADSQNLGKPVLKDLAQGVVNLPVFFTLLEGNQAEKRLVRESMAKKKLQVGKCEQLLQLVRRDKGCDKARFLAYKYLQRAIDLLESIGPINQTSLQFLCWQVINPKK